MAGHWNFSISSGSRDHTWLLCLVSGQQWRFYLWSGVPEAPACEQSYSSDGWWSQGSETWSVDSSMPGSRAPCNRTCLWLTWSGSVLSPSSVCGRIWRTYPPRFSSQLHESQFGTRYRSNFLAWSSLCLHAAHARFLTSSPDWSRFRGRSWWGKSLFPCHPPSPLRLWTVTSVKGPHPMMSPSCLQHHRLLLYPHQFEAEVDLALRSCSYSWWASLLLLRNPKR